MVTKFSWRIGTDAVPTKDSLAKRLSFMDTLWLCAHYTRMLHNLLLISFLNAQWLKQFGWAAVGGCGSTILMSLVSLILLS